MGIQFQIFRLCLVGFYLALAPAHPQEFYQIFCTKSLFLVKNRRVRAVLEEADSIGALQEYFFFREEGLDFIITVLLHTFP